MAGRVKNASFFPVQSVKPSELCNTKTDQILQHRQAYRVFPTTFPSLVHFRKISLGSGYSLIPIYLKTVMWLAQQTSN